MHEASKTRALRDAAFHQRYLSGAVLDIGSGDDLVVPYATPFDKVHGDANRIGDYFAPETFDCVCSSHVLEHMHDPRDDAAAWWSLVKPGGHMVTVVPDARLYEQGIWPSLFNPDHKSRFGLDAPPGGGPRDPELIDIEALMAGLPNAELVSADRHDVGYDHRLLRDRAPDGFRLFIGRIGHYVRVLALRKRLLTRPLDRLFARCLFAVGAPIDQTLGDAMAQIQVVVRKAPTAGAETTAPR